MGIFPIRRVHVREEGLVILVLGDKRQKGIHSIYTKAPAQDEPEPAVQAKQCSPVTILRFIKISGVKKRI